jgi:hypothetical protein
MGNRRGRIVEYFNLFCIVILFIQSSILMSKLEDKKQISDEELLQLKKDIKLVARNPNLARKTFENRNDGV